VSKTIYFVDNLMVLLLLFAHYL